MQSSQPIPEQSANEPNEPTSEPIDLGAIQSAHPVNQRTMVMDLATFDASALTLLEVLDVAEAAGVTPASLGALMGGSASDPRKVRMLYALAWVIMRRADPLLRFSDVIRWKLDVRGKLDVAISDPTRARARARVNAAKLTGLSPNDAERLTVAELDAYRQSQPKPRAARGRKR